MENFGWLESGHRWHPYFHIHSSCFCGWSLPRQAPDSWQQLQPLHPFLSKPSGENMGSLSPRFWKFSSALVCSCVHPWKGPLWPGGHSGQADQAWAKYPPSANDCGFGSDPRGESRYGFRRTGMDVGWQKTQKTTQLTSWRSNIHKHPSLHFYSWGKWNSRIMGPEDVHPNLWKQNLSLT